MDEDDDDDIDEEFVPLIIQTPSNNKGNRAKQEGRIKNQILGVKWFKML